MRDSISIYIHNLSKIYQRDTGGVFPALSDVSLTVKKGEVWALIGSNGAGKSTLLKLISGLAKPTRGDIKIRGRVASILEIGSGFHPDLTGRDNVYMSSALAGFSKKETDFFFEKIADFSELKDWMNEPVKNYSSGMYLRLAFSTIIHWRTDILLLDEVMSVGDAVFRDKCFNAIQKLANTETTMVIAGHNNSELAAIATHGLWLDNGQARKFGAFRQVADAYMTNVYNTHNNIDDRSSIVHKVTETNETLRQTGEVIQDISTNQELQTTHKPTSTVSEFNDEDPRFSLKKIAIKASASLIRTDKPLHLEIEFQYTDLISVEPMVLIYTIDGLLISSFCYAWHEPLNTSLSPDNLYRLIYHFKPYHFHAGTYYLSLIIGGNKTFRLVSYEKVLLFSIPQTIDTQNKPWGQLPAGINSCPEWELCKLE